jgi:hypothetical protein
VLSQLMPRMLSAGLLPSTTSTKRQSFRSTSSSLSLPIDVNSTSLSVLILMKARSRLTSLFYLAQQQWSTLQILPVDSVVTVVVGGGDATPRNHVAKLRSNTKLITSESSEKRETLVIHVGTPNFGMPIRTWWAARFSAFGMRPACFIWLSVTKIPKNGMRRPC